MESGSEGGDDQADDFAPNDGALSPALADELKDDIHGANGSMELDDDEEEIDEDEEMMDRDMQKRAQVEDTDETKARIEKMQLGGVGDVRSVAVLMKSLQPVLEVSSFPALSFPCFRIKVFGFTASAKSSSPDYRRRPTENRTLPRLAAG